MAPRLGTLAAVGALAGLALAMWGGYHDHWTWTGINGHSATLWDWLNLLMLPAAFAVLPLWWRHRRRLGRRHLTAAGLLTGGFALLVLVGYLAPLTWTGFPGNTLWDWLELLLLPLVVAGWPVWREEWAGVRAVHVGVGGLALIALAVAAVGGYAWGWSWTGFAGNTLWDWLHLLLLPAVFAVLAPLLTDLATAGLAGKRAGADGGADRPPPETAG